MNTQQLGETLQALIRRDVPGAAGARAEGLSPLAGGNAHRAFAFRASWEGESRDCVLLARTEPGQLDVDPRMEFDVLTRLHGRNLPVPIALCIDADGQTLGMQGIVMERVAGRSDIGELLQLASLITRVLAQQLAGIAAGLHGQPMARCRPCVEAGRHAAHLARTFRGSQA